MIPAASTSSVPTNATAVTAAADVATGIFAEAYYNMYCISSKSITPPALLIRMRSEVLVGRLRVPQPALRGHRCHLRPGA